MRPVEMGKVGLGLGECFRIADGAMRCLGVGERVGEVGRGGLLSLFGGMLEKWVGENLPFLRGGMMVSVDGGEGCIG